MSAKHGTAIEWTHPPGFKGETWNPVTGCDRISPGCALCYARTMAKRLKAMGNPRYQKDGDGPGFGVTVHPDLLDEPRRWRKPRCVFVNSMSDLFHDEVPDTFIARVYEAMRVSPQHLFLILTKRPERARDWYLRFAPAFERFATSAWPLPNVWLGVSIENARHTWRADVLREIPAAVRFISAEPLLGSLVHPGHVTLERAEGVEARISASGQTQRAPLDLTGIDWLIVGGESGPGARPMRLEWAWELVAARIEDGGALFVKQLGARPIDESGQPLRLRDRKGGDPDEWPPHFRVRDWPGSTA